MWLSVIAGLMFACARGRPYKLPDQFERASMMTALAVHLITIRALPEYLIVTASFWLQ